jgi:large subunit ribosomal protein L6
VTGPKGALECALSPKLTITQDAGLIAVQRPGDEPRHRALHGLTRALIQNMVIGVTQGFAKVLQITGVGYRAAMQGQDLTLSLGYSHPITVQPPKGITFSVDGTQTIRIEGIDKQLVGQVAANVRAWRKPEPYKGKGIRYETERIRRKVGKAGGAK